MTKKRNTIGKTPVYQYLKRIESHFPYLLENKKITVPTRDSFFQQFLGCGKTTYNNWWVFGIKKIYLVVLFLLDEIKTHKERIDILEKQLDELTK